MNCLGLVDHALGNFAEAMKNYNESIKINKELNDQKISVNYSNIGKLYLSFGDYKKAKSFLDDALDIDLKENNKEKLAIRYNDLALIYDNYGQQDFGSRISKKPLTLIKLSAKRRTYQNIIITSAIFILTGAAMMKR